MHRTVFLVLSLAAMLGPTGAGAVPIATFVGLGPVATGLTKTPLVVSGDGTVVVGADLVNGHFEAFRWTVAEGRVGLDIPGPPLGISADGSVLVGVVPSESSSGGFPTAFRWTAQTGLQELGVLPGGTLTASFAFDVSDDGSVVVGRSSSSAHGVEGFRWTATDGMVGLGDLGCGSGAQCGSTAIATSADGSVIVGQAGLDRPFRWTSEDGMVGLGLLPGWSHSNAADVSADGSVVVGSAGGAQVFRWTAEEGMVGIGRAGILEVHAASADASILVGFAAGRAAAWDLNLGPEAHDIQKLLTQEYGLDLTDWELRFATDVSSDGQTLVGVGFNPSGQVEGWRATIPLLVPEPGTLTLLALGLGALTSFRCCQAPARCGSSPPLRRLGRRPV
jgi:probable HAF family extracellular repeat protein